MKTYPWQMWISISIFLFGVAFVAYWVGFCRGGLCLGGFCRGGGGFCLYPYQLTEDIN